MSNQLNINNTQFFYNSNNAADAPIYAKLTHVTYNPEIKQVFLDAIREDMRRQTNDSYIPLPPPKMVVYDTLPPEVSFYSHQEEMPQSQPAVFQQKYNLFSQEVLFYTLESNLLPQESSESVD